MYSEIIDKHQTAVYWEQAESGTHTRGVAQYNGAYKSQEGSDQAYKLYFFSSNQFMNHYL